MKTILCGSMSASKEMIAVKDVLTKRGHKVEMPPLDNIDQELDSAGNSKETAQIKMNNDLIRGYFNKIKGSDAVLIVNPDKNNIRGYIGPNTFLEIGFAHVLRKNIYILNEFSGDIPFTDEINAMQPVVLGGSLEIFLKDS